MNFARTQKAVFELDKPLPAEYFSEGLRPTVTVLLREPSAEILLVLPALAVSNSSAFMFPQGPILRHMTPKEAMTQLLQTECGYDSDIVNFAEAKALGICSVGSETGQAIKMHFIIFASLKRFRKPTLSEVNRKWLYARGPNNLWSKIYQCRPEKKRLIITSVFKAVDDGLLYSQRWNKDRFTDIRGFGATTFA